MTQYPQPRTNRPAQTLAAATAATLISFTLLWSVVHLFQSRGAPLEQLAAAERACAGSAYVSDRKACMQQWASDHQRVSVATGGIAY
jgi:hypothetical protein